MIRLIVSVNNDLLLSDFDANLWYYKWYMVYFFLIGALILNSVANILIKTAAVVPIPDGSTLISLIRKYTVMIFVVSQ